MSEVGEEVEVSEVEVEAEVSGRLTALEVDEMDTSSTEAEVLAAAEALITEAVRQIYFLSKNAP